LASAAAIENPAHSAEDVREAAYICDRRFIICAKRRLIARSNEEVRSEHLFPNTSETIDAGPSLITPLGARMVENRTTEMKLNVFISYPRKALELEQWIVL